METIQIAVKYFALIREKTGLSEEKISTRAKTPEELYEILNDKYHFHLDRGSLKVAINEEFGNWNQTLRDGDELVFMTPVAGG